MAIEKLIKLAIGLSIALLCNIISSAATVNFLPSPKISFWNTPKKGANIFNQKIRKEDLRIAKSYNINFIRLTPDKWQTTKRDFLQGNADRYKKLVPNDLNELQNILSMFSENKLPVVLTVLSLPGSRWKQNNRNEDDLRLWKDIEFQKQAAKYWQDIAMELKDNPAIVGYNILNEPHLNKIFADKKAQDILYEFYKQIIISIREVDSETPIILDSLNYADPQAFGNFKPLEFTNILYSFHMYEPYHYTNQQLNQGQSHYPGIINGEKWDKEKIKRHIKNVLKFQAEYSIASNRILVGEYGAHRKSKGLPQYLKDLIDVFNENKWHYSFYAFREDTWDGMDYELGNQNGPPGTLHRKIYFPPFQVLWKDLNSDQ